MGLAQSLGGGIAGFGLLLALAGLALLRRFRQTGLHVIASGAALILMGGVIAFAVKL